MGQLAQKISKVNHDELLKMLNIAYAEEWLAYYQYWVGAQVAVGPMRKVIAGEFMEHANEELEHAQKLSARIIELGGTPVLNPDVWQKVALCKYDEPSKPYIINLLESNVVAERCAIARYQKICEMTDGKDIVTYQLAAEILKDEVEHEDELEAYQEDIKETFSHQNKPQD